jgi:hypothetical protein
VAAEGAGAEVVEAGLAAEVAALVAGLRLRRMRLDWRRLERQIAISWRSAHRIPWKFHRFFVLIANVLFSESCLLANDDPHQRFYWYVRWSESYPHRSAPWAPVVAQKPIRSQRMLIRDRDSICPFSESGHRDRQNRGSRS